MPHQQLGCWELLSTEHQSNASVVPRITFIFLIVTEVINSHLVYYSTACCCSSCNYTILSFSAVSDSLEEDTLGSRGRGYYTDREHVSVSAHLFFWLTLEVCHLLQILAPNAKNAQPWNCILLTMINEP